MPGRNSFSLMLLFTLLGAILAPRAAWAQWVPNGVALGDHCRPREGQVGTGGSGGVLAVWQDTRESIPEPYAQHLTDLGTRAPGWSPAAFKVITGQFPGDFIDQVIPDGSGGMFVALEGGPPATFVDITLQRVLPGGTLPSGWSPSGARVAWTTDDERNSTVCRDLGGG